MAGQAFLSILSYVFTPIVSNICSMEMAIIIHMHKQIVHAQLLFMEEPENLWQLQIVASYNHKVILH